MPRQTFEKVKYTTTATMPSGKKRSRTFHQTINPFNRNGDGEVKTRQEIMCELHDRADAWKLLMESGDIQ